MAALVGALWHHFGACIVEDGLELWTDVEADDLVGGGVARCLTTRGRLPGSGLRCLRERCCKGSREQGAQKKFGVHLGSCDAVEVLQWVSVEVIVWSLIERVMCNQDVKELDKVKMRTVYMNGRRW